MQRPKCPLIEYGCRQEACAWWDESSQGCAVTAALNLLKDIQHKLDTQVKETAKKE